MLAVRGGLGILLGLVVLLSPLVGVGKLVVLFGSYAFLDGIWAVGWAVRASRRPLEGGPVVLEGALSRALKPRVRVPVSSPKAVFDEPAPDTIRPADVPVATHAVDVPVADAVLDPFEVHAHGEAFLRAKLSALARRHLVDIIVAYDLSDEPVSSLAERSTLSLIELIINAVRVRSRG